VELEEVNEAAKQIIAKGGAEISRFLGPGAVLVTKIRMICSCSQCC
jgi:hypothetical protein